MKKILFLIALTNLIICEYNYEKQGTDWVEGSCNSQTSNQSPINLYGMMLNDNSLKGDLHIEGGLIKVTQTNSVNSVKIDITTKKDWKVFFGIEEEKTRFVRMEFDDGENIQQEYLGNQISFHVPSEHKLNNLQLDMEMQIFGESDYYVSDNKLTGLSFLFLEDDTAPDNPMIQQILDRMDSLVSTYYLIFADFFKSLPKSNTFYHYKGSRTTPGCDENVEWYVNKNVARINPTQLTKFKERWVKDSFNSQAGQGNNRALQQIGNRNIWSGSFMVQNNNWERMKWGYLAMSVILVTLVMVCAGEGYLVYMRHQVRILNLKTVKVHPSTPVKNIELDDSNKHMSQQKLLKGDQIEDLAEFTEDELLEEQGELKIEEEVKEEEMQLEEIEIGSEDEEEEEEEEEEESEEEESEEEEIEESEEKDPPQVMEKLGDQSISVIKM